MKRKHQLKPRDAQVDSYLLRLVNRQVGRIRRGSLLLFAPWDADCVRKQHCAGYDQSTAVAR